MDLRNYFFELTPLGKADKDVKEYMKERLTDQQIERYGSALSHYRHIKVFQGALKILLYASIITSVATTVGLEQAQLLQKIASYLGTSLILILYAVTSYITMIRREAYHVQREILISKASAR